MAKKKITGADAVVLSLIAEGVDTIFGYPGGAIMPVYDSLYRYDDQITHILTRHEQGAAHAAQGYARVSGKVGVAMATSGPGATNLITGVADAMIDSTPMVCITGQVAAHLLGTDAFQETDVVGISMPVTKWNVQVAKAQDIPAAIAKAFHIAGSGRPGPVIVDITKNAQVEEMEEFEYKKCTKVRSYLDKPKLRMPSIDAAAELINNSKKPFVLCGHGVTISGAQKQLQKLVEKADIPVACTLLGLGAFPGDHELYTGMVGMHGNYAPNIKTNECDVLIAVGMRFDDRVTGDLNRYAKQAKVIHIDIDETEIDKNVVANVAVVADAKEALEALIQKVEKNSHSAWKKEFEEAYRKEFDKVIRQELTPDPKKGLQMAEVVNMISEKTKGKAIVVTDVGQHQMIGARYYKFTDYRTNITSGGLGTMGFCLPAAFGASWAKPEKDCVAIIGDGGFQMTIQELGTIWQNKTPVKILILNNNFLGMVRQWQELFFDKRYASTELQNPDFIKISEGYYIPARKVEMDSRPTLEENINWFLNHEGACLLEVCVEKEGNVFPMIPTGSAVSDVKLEP